MILAQFSRFSQHSQRPIFFKYHRIKLNDGYIFSETFIIHVLEKSSQEINFKIQSNSITLCKEKCYQICTCPVWIYFILLVCANFYYNEIKDANYRDIGMI